LLTTAGMQQFKKYYTGEADPMADFGSKNTASVQKSFRTSDIDEVGDESHLTFFEMLGNFSFGGYFKDEAIKLAHEFITKEMGLTISYVTVFKGNTGAGVPPDEESKAIWRAVDPKIEIREDGMEDVFWGPTGETGPCGPTTEIYCKNGAGQDIEIWNIVFNEFLCNGSREELLQGSAKLNPLPFKGIDTGMGLERLAMVVQGTKTIFETDLFTPIQMFTSTLASYDLPARRIIGDHFRAAVFLTADGVLPSNTGRGYILRRLIRRSILKAQNKRIAPSEITALVEVISFAYRDAYGELYSQREQICQVIITESEQFQKTLQHGLKEFEKLSIANISGKDAFMLFSTYGFPIELTRELASIRKLQVDTAGFAKEFEKHQEVSRAGAHGNFKGGLADTSEKTTKLHTAHHLLLKALQIVLGPQVRQRGSNITQERLRIDFSHGEKMTDEQKKEVERIVNEKIKENLPVVRTEMVREEAEKLHAEHEFGAKYPERVSVYSVGPLSSAFSIEFCGGPHVENTGVLGAFKIQKEEAVAAGIRRIKAVLS
ncbi:MAG: alanine--tRNA ligase, partial [bacterium]|nr:alanine--tRNA ligase [bacterium]